MKNCRECGSEKIVPNVRVADKDQSGTKQNLSLVFDESPDALVFKNRLLFDLKANVCGNCGYVQLFAENYKDLWYAYQK